MSHRLFSGPRGRRTRAHRPLLERLDDRITPAVTDVSSAYNFEQVKLGGGGFAMDVVFHPTAANVRFATTDTAGAFRWDAGAARWVTMDTASSLPASVNRAGSGGSHGVAVSPSDPNVVLMAWGGDGNPGNVYRSADGGRTFAAANLSVPVSANDDASKTARRLTFDPNNANIAWYASQANGLFRSADGGRTFSQVTAPGAPATNSNVTVVVPDKSSGTDGAGRTRVVYAATYYGAVLRSDNAGDSWQNISASTGGVNGKWVTDAATDPAGNFYANGNGLWRYNAASGWSQRLTSQVSSFAIDPASVDRIFALEGGGRARRTLNGGQNWTDLGAALRSSPDVPWLQQTEEGYFSTAKVRFDPTASNTLYIAQGIGVWYTQPNDSSNGQLTWVSRVKGMENMVARQVVAPPGRAPVFTVEDRTAFVLPDAGSYSAVQSTLQGNSAIANGTSVDYSPNAPGYMAAVSWNFQGGNFANNPYYPNYPGYSTDGGRTWTLFGSVTNFQHPSVLSAGDLAVSARSNPNAAVGSDNIVWLPKDDFAPFYTRDGGRTWQQSQSFNGLPRDTNYTGPYTKLAWATGMFNGYVKANPLVADPVTPGRFYLYLTLGGVWRTDNGGETWTRLSANNAQVTQYGFHAHLAAAPGRSNHLWFVSGFDGATTQGLWRSTDGAAQFTKIADVTEADALAVGAAAPGASYPTVYIAGVVGGQRGVFRSTDEGANWQKLAANPLGVIEQIYSLAADPSSFGKVYVALAGRGFAVGTPTSPPPPPAGGGGLAATYYDNIDFTGTTVSRTDGPVNFDWGTGSPAAGIGADTFSARWTGRVQAVEAGAYQFRTYSDDGVRLWVNGQQVINNWTDHAPTYDTSGTVTLAAGQRYDVRMDFFENGGGATARLEWKRPGQAGFEAVPAAQLSTGAGTVTREFWTGVGGTTIADIPVAAAPSGTGVLTSLEGPTNWADNYGARVRGYITAPATGSYTFWVAGDDNSEFRIGSSPANAPLVASVNGWTNSREWNKYASQKSAAVTLTAGQRYYFEVLHKEGGGGDNIAVGWSRPGQSTVSPSEVVPGGVLSPYFG